MNDTERPSRPVVQRVAKNLRLRGGSYEFRKWIPPEARALFDGRKEFLRSYGDVTRRQADELAAFHRAYCSKLIREARQQLKPSHRIADLVRVRRVPDHGEIERAVRAWVVGCERKGLLSNTSSPNDTIRDLGFLDAEIIRQMRHRRGEAPLTTQWIADHLCEQNEWMLPNAAVRSFLENRVARGQRELAARIKADLDWDGAPQPTHRMFAPSEYQRDTEQREAQSSWVSIARILGAYLAERQPAAKTAKKWTTAINSLVVHLGHDNAGSVRPEDIVAWKDALLAPDANGTKRTGQTVRNGYIGAAKAVFGWAKQNRLVLENPASGVTVHAPPTVKNRPEKGFTEAEAKLVLSAAMAIGSDANHSFGMFARRWLPWLCAYTGARAAEMAQLRREDIGQTDDGIWYVTVRPEAGSQKGYFARQVALHPHLIEQGFIEAVSCRSGPLFYDPSKRRKASSANPQYTKAAQRVAEWVRDAVGLRDTELQPNHGWRHRFVTVANDIGIPNDVCRAILGHVAKDVHQSYGNVLVRTSFRWLSRYPRYEFGPTGSEGESLLGGAEILQPVATAAERGPLSLRTSISVTRRFARAIRNRTVRHADPSPQRQRWTQRSFDDGTRRSQSVIWSICWV